MLYLNIKIYGISKVLSSDHGNICATNGAPFKVSLSKFLLTNPYMCVGHMTIHIHMYVRVCLCECLYVCLGLYVYACNKQSECDA